MNSRKIKIAKHLLLTALLSLASIQASAIIEISSTTCICPGGYGSIELTVEPDPGMQSAGPFTFQWTGPNNFSSTAQNIEQLTAPGLYTVVVTNDYGCEITLSTELTQCQFNFDDFELEINNACGGPGTGSITVQVPSNYGITPMFLFVTPSTGGNPLVFNFSNGNATAANLDAGEYCVIVTSTNGCFVEECGILIEEYEALTYTPILTPATNGGSDGSIVLDIPSNFQPYTIVWDDNSDGVNLYAGMHCATITYANGNCSVHPCFDLLDCEGLSAAVGMDYSVEVHAANNTAGTNPFIDLTMTNLPGYSFNFEWTSLEDPSYFQTTEDIFDLKPGNNYCLIVNHNFCSLPEFGGCFEICNMAVSIFTTPDPPQIQCNGLTVAVQVEGENPVSYLWNTGSIGPKEFIHFNDEYSVTITDANGCSAVTQDVLELPGLSLSASVTNSTFGSNNGTMTVNVSGGVLPYTTYLWDAPGQEPPFLAGPTINQLKPGEYCVTVTDICNSTASICATVQCEFGTNVLSAVVQPINCELGKKGKIYLTVSNIVNQPVFQWSNGAQTEDINELVAGQYCVTVTSSTGCFVTNCFTVPGAAGGFDVNFSQVIPCLGGSNGQLTALPQSGATPFTYNWFGVEASSGDYVNGNTSTLNNLAAGWYNVTVTDKLGCSVTDMHFLWAVPKFAIAPNVSPNPVCFGGTATATLNLVPNITGGSTGVPPYTYSWQNQACFPNCPPETTIYPVDYKVLPAGVWTVTVTDADGCRASKYFYIYQKKKVEVFKDNKGDICTPEGGSTYGGSIEIIEVTGGTPPYSYEWCCGLPSISHQYNLSVGNYSVTITDPMGCTGTKAYTLQYLTQPIISSLTATNANCICCTIGGAVQITVENYNQPFYLTHYQNNGSGLVPMEITGPYSTSSITFNNLAVGKYHNFIAGYSPSGSTSGNCNSIWVNTGNVMILPNNPIVINTDNISSIPGFINISVSGGAPIYSYLWSNGATSQDLNNIGPGTYIVTVTDQIGCIKTKSFQICNNPPSISSYSLPTQEFIIPCETGKEVGSIQGPTPTSGTAPYTYSWAGPGNFTANTQDILGLSKPGQYCLTITDACHMKMTYCKELKCDCELDVGYGGDNCAQDDPGKFEIFGINPTEQEYRIEWWDGETTEVWVEADGDLVVLNGGTLEKTIAEPFAGYKCVTVVDVVFGCNKQICRYYYGDDICLYNFLSFDNQQNELEDYLEENYGYYPDFVNRCDSDNPCGGSDGDPENIEFRPYSLNGNPCQNGGIIECDKCFDDMEINVQENNFGIQFQVDNKCYCLWPTIMFSEDEDFINAISYSASIGDGASLEDPWLWGLVAEYDCDGANEPPPPGGGGEIDDECIEAACDLCPEECIVDTDPVTCSFNVYCPEQNPEDGQFCSIPGITTRICKIPEGEFSGICSIWEQCTLDPCQYTVLFECPDCTPAIFEQYGLADLIDCTYGFPNKCSCSEIENSAIPYCIFCDQNQPFTGNGGNQGENNLNYPAGDKTNLYQKNENKNMAPRDRFITTVFPNPFRDGLSIQISIPNECSISMNIYNLLGEQIWNDTQNLQAGSSQIEWVPVEGFPFGIYQLVIRDENGNFAVHKVVYSRQ